MDTAALSGTIAMLIAQEMGHVRNHCIDDSDNCSCFFVFAFIKDQSILSEAWGRLLVHDFASGFFSNQNPVAVIHFVLDNLRCKSFECTGPLPESLILIFHRDSLITFCFSDSGKRQASFFRFIRT